MVLLKNYIEALLTGYRNEIKKQYSADQQLLLIIHIISYIIRVVMYKGQDSSQSWSTIPDSLMLLAMKSKE